jgi:hypothetical protein
MMRWIPIGGAVLCLVLADVFHPDTSPLKIAAGVLFWVFVWWAVVAYILRRRRRSQQTTGSRASDATSTSATTRVPAGNRATRTRQRCARHHNKAIFATEADARAFVERTQRRYADGQENRRPMDHWYRCPALFSDHWHVSSKPRRPW